MQSHLKKVAIEHYEIVIYFKFIMQTKKPHLKLKENNFSRNSITNLLHNQLPTQLRKGKGTSC